jgi:hypothetical protein
MRNLEIREAKVIADCLTHLCKRRLVDTIVSATNRCTFKIRLLLRKIDIEQVNFVVAAHNTTFIIDKKTPIKDFVVGAVNSD